MPRRPIVDNLTHSGKNVIYHVRDSEASVGALFCVFVNSLAGERIDNSQASLFIAALRAAE